MIIWGKFRDSLGDKRSLRTISDDDEGKKVWPTNEINRPVPSPMKIFFTPLWSVFEARWFTFAVQWLVAPKVRIWYWMTYMLGLLPSKSHLEEPILNKSIPALKSCCRFDITSLNLILPSDTTSFSASLISLETLSLSTLEYIGLTDHVPLDCSEIPDCIFFFLFFLVWFLS